MIAGRRREQGEGGSEWGRGSWVEEVEKGEEAVRVEEGAGGRRK